METLLTYPGCGDVFGGDREALTTHGQIAGMVGCPCLICTRAFQGVSLGQGHRCGR